jgi:hypothetical protein
MSDTRTYFAKVENGVVTDVRVVAWDFLVANPDRYGDSTLWVETFCDTAGKTYAGIGFTYDPDLDDFVPPPAPEPVEP